MTGEHVGQVAADRGRGHLLFGAAPDAAVRVVLGEHVRVTGAQPDRRGAFPGVGEPVDLGELDGAGVAHQQLEHAAGAHRGELVVVAGVEQFRPGLGDQRRDLVEFGGAGHAGLIEHEQVGRVEPLAHPPVRIGAEPGEELAGVDRGQTVVDEHAGGDL